MNLLLTPTSDQRVYDEHRSAIDRLADIEAQIEVQDMQTNESRRSVMRCRASSAGGSTLGGSSDGLEQVPEDHSLGESGPERWSPSSSFEEPPSFASKVAANV